MLVCFGNRSAPDQFEAIVGNDFGLFDPVNAGGMASREIIRHDRMLPPTRLMPIDVIGDGKGFPLNISYVGIKFPQGSNLNKVIPAVGSDMNSAKTFTAALVG